MIIRRPGHGLEICQAPHVSAIQIHGVHFGNVTLLRKVSPDDPLAVRREKGATIITGHKGQPLLVGAIGVHDVNLPEIRDIVFQLHLLLVREILSFVCIADRAKNNFTTIGRIRALRIVPQRIGETLKLFTPGGRTENIHALIVIPRVTTCLTGSSKVQLGLLFFHGLRIHMSTGKQHLITTRPKKSARGLARPRRYSRYIAGFQAHGVDLIKRIPLLSFALEDDVFAVG